MMKGHGKNSGQPKFRAFDQKFLQFLLSPLSSFSMAHVKDIRLLILNSGTKSNTEA